MSTPLSWDAHTLQVVPFA